MYKNKKILVLGMARSGFEAAKILASDNTVLVTDMNEQNPENKETFIGLTRLVYNTLSNLLDILAIEEVEKM